MGRRLLPPLAFMASTALVVACSLIVTPREAPRLCAGQGTDCGDGYECVEVGEGDWRCVARCDDDDDCVDTAGRPHCRDGLCVECTNDGECTDAAFPVCSEDNACIPGCRTDAQCTDPQYPHCDGSRCVACIDSTHCEAGSYCRGNTCVPGCEGPEHCPEGHRCVDNVCLEPRPEMCNGEDDDLDGEVDEDFDRDQDGVSSCLEVDDPPDCNDASEEAFPGHEEVCDQLDNDCDGETNEGELCPEGYVCLAAEAECVPSECTVDGDCDNPATEFCHDDGVCYPRSVGFAEACVRDSQCGSGLLCIDTNPLGHPGRYCTRACCGPSDCGEPDTWCADTGMGLKVCAPSGWFGGLRTGCGFVSCPTCIEVVAGLLYACGDQCCSDDDCGSYGCQLAQARTVATGGDVRPMFVCDYRESGSGLYEVIDCGWLSSESCLSGLSWPLGGARCQCTSPCCSHDDCTTSGHDDARCVLDSSGYVGCYDPTTVGALGSGAFGDACTHGDGIEDCASGVCHPDGYCTEVCCPGTRCAQAGTTCRPVTVTGGRAATLCAMD